MTSFGTVRVEVGGRLTMLTNGSLGAHQFVQIDGALQLSSGVVVDSDGSGVGGIGFLVRGNVRAENGSAIRFRTPLLATSGALVRVAETAVVQIVGASHEMYGLRMSGRMSVESTARLNVAGDCDADGIIAVSNGSTIVFSGSDIVLRRGVNARQQNPPKTKNGNFQNRRRKKSGKTERTKHLWNGPRLVARQTSRDLRMGNPAISRGLRPMPQGQ
jgi:hypothetical protein